MKRRQFLHYGLGALAGSMAAGRFAYAADKLKVGVLIPLSGPAALFGPSSRNCIDMGIADINARGGILGRQLEALVADAGVPPAQASQAALRLWRGRHAEVLIGQHDSAVREAVAGVINGQIPYIYTPVTEGGGCSKAVYVIGETPQQQLMPVVPWLAEHKKSKRWYLIGNDYIWPRKSNEAGKQAIAASGGTVVGEEYVPFTVDNFDASLARIRDSGADSVLVTLVGGASVGFNRAFASFGLPDKVLRLCTLLEENTLLGIGAQNAQNLYSSSGYFAALTSPDAQAFAKRYASQFDAAKAPLNGLAESCYEGLLLLEAMAAKAGSLKPEAMDKAAAAGVSYDGPRGKTVLQSRYTTKSIYLAQADGSTFRIVQEFANVPPGQSCAK